MSTLHTVYRFADRLVFWTTALLTGAILLLMSVLVIHMVVARYVLHAPIFWGEECARLLMFFLVLIGSAVSLRLDQHPRLTLIADLLPLPLRRSLRVLVDAAVIGTLLVLLLHGVDLALEEAIMRTPSLRISYFWVYLAYPVGAFLALLQLAGSYLQPRLTEGFGGEAAGP
ncbi:TRAP transporter small permease subunit [Azospirillum sp. RWY-5-1]|uniref:TRAP transporter small permease protein n=1 Tax=Azospirillum oleiclasticum TaxID=2735135 RepID=A0ABX2TCI1_9PROT|nr:TRAP transporter small permease subunit [Azospirillum oleiclasticum]NYZ13950.1 TRAP transporter small permease subunit [Azospirillum oleiclasticum]NYZ20873.1 TRAP transporter small permease subunit [Azospirillum oleiclasticum]